MRVNLSGLKNWQINLIAVLAGALYSLAFAPLNLIPLAWLSPLVLFWLWLSLSPRRALMVGFYFGFGLFGVGLSWVYVAIHVFGNTPMVIAAIFTAVFAAILAAFIAVQGWCSIKLYKSFHIPLVLQWLVVFPFCWVLFEWIRGWFLTGMPWLQIGYAMLDMPLAGYAPVLGVYGVSLMTALAVGLAGFLLTQIKHIRALYLYMGVAAIAGIFLAGGLLGRIEWTMPVGGPIKVSLVQGNVPQITKWDADKIQQRLDTYKNLTEQGMDSDAIIWPENSMSVFYHQIAEDYLLPLAKKLRDKNIDLIVGLPVMDDDFEHYYSSMMSFAGDKPHAFHKTHLVPFGEYIPLAFLRGLVAFFDLPMSNFSSGGEHQTLLRMQGQPLATSICYEDAFGNELIRQLPQATLLLNGSNNAWYGNSFAPHQHLQISRMRSLETGRMMMRATTNGISAFIDHRGKILARSPQFKSYVLTHYVQPRRGTTPYVEWGNWPVISFILFGLMAVIFSTYRRKSTEVAMNNA